MKKEDENHAGGTAFPDLPGNPGNRGVTVAEIIEDLVVLGGILGICLPEKQRLDDKAPGRF